MKENKPAQDFVDKLTINPSGITIIAVFLGMILLGIIAVSCTTDDSSSVPDDVDYYDYQSSPGYGGGY